MSHKSKRLGNTMWNFEYYEFITLVFTHNPLWKVSNVVYMLKQTCVKKKIRHFHLKWRRIIKFRKVEIPREVQIAHNLYNSLITKHHSVTHSFLPMTSGGSTAMHQAGQLKEIQYIWNLFDIYKLKIYQTNKNVSVLKLSWNPVYIFSNHSMWCPALQDNTLQQHDKA